MIKTLQLYITRELLKTFALTAIGLTLTFTLCGLVFNMIEAEMLTAVQMLRILGFVFPVSATITLPVSALFACAMVYGRFAADNEFDACKASGINIHRLLAPALGLSVAIAAFTFTFANFILPSFAEAIENIVRADIQKVVTQALTTRGYIRYGPYTLHARKAFPYEGEKGARGLEIRQAAFLELENEKLVRCGTAEAVRVAFTPGEEGQNPMVEAAMHSIVALDLVHNQLQRSEKQRFNPMRLPSRFEQKVKWLNLGDLFRYLRHPMEFGQMRDYVARLRLLVRDALFYRYAVEQLTGPEKVLKLGDGRRGYEIRAGYISQDPKDFQPTLSSVTVKERWDDRQREYKAGACSLRVKRGFAEAGDAVHITLSGKVTFVDALDPDRVNEHKQLDLENVPVPASIAEEEKALSDDELLGLAGLDSGEPLSYAAVMGRSLTPLGLGQRIEDSRYSLLKELGQLGLEITGIIHSRLAFSASTLVMLVLAAGLAIIYRGGQLLTAFVISFIPGLFVVVLNIMGRQLSENPPTQMVGLGIIWSGIALLAVADVVVLAKYLKR